MFEISDEEFCLYRNFIYEVAGIKLEENKKTLVTSRLAKRLRYYNLDTYGEYFDLIKANIDGEQQVVVNLLTTNETYFFREPRHFDFLRDVVIPKHDARELRYWSAASSTGEEAYSLAMTLAEYARTHNWNVVGTDISTHVLERAMSGHYTMDRLHEMPTNILHKYCLKGVDSQDGTMLICDDVRSKVKFFHANLKNNLSNLGQFDVIFLRNVLLYFDIKTKQAIITNMLRQLKPEGYLFISHSENLYGVTDDVVMVRPSIYQKAK